MSLIVENLFCEYGDEKIVKSLSITIEKGQFVCLLGPSGCGKTTLLRAVAGFQKIKSGKVVIDNLICNDELTNVLPENRRVGMIFQDPSLFPHLTVTQNIQSGMSAFTKTERNRATEYFLEQMKLGGEKNRYPHELSGGQAQRVAIARSLSSNPAVLLMDEPFSGLDQDLREMLINDISNFLKENNTTCLMVTHDQNDAFAFASFIGIMNSGSIDQWAKPHQIYQHPSTRFVANFIGSGYFLDGVVIKENKIKTEYFEFEIRENRSLIEGAKVDVFLRPEDVSVNQKNGISVRVQSKLFQGSNFLYNLAAPNKATFLASFSTSHNFNLNEEIKVCFNPSHYNYFVR